MSAQVVSVPRGSLWPMTTSTALLLSLATLLVGALVGWLAHATRAARAHRSEEMELVRLHADVESVRREAAGLREQLDLARDDAERRVAEVRAEAARQVAEAKGDQEAAARRFQALAGEVLQSSSKQFLELAEQRLRQSTVKNDEVLAQREQAFRALVDPLSRSLEKVREEVTAAEKARAEGTSALTEHLRQLASVNAELRQGTSDLITALRSSQTRGAWGELQLKRVVEAAGMLEHVDFDTQVSVTSTDGDALRPDMVVNLAGGKRVVVDAKVAFLGYLEAQQTEDPRVREERLDAHVRHVRKHVDDLASKKYWDQFDHAPEFVVMFVPAEAFLSAAMERQPDLMEYAARKNVILASPAIMLGLLRTVAFAWRQEALAENAQEVLKVGRELHSRLVTMTNHITKMGRSLESSTKAYNSMIGSLERNVLTSARRMVELHVVDEKDRIDEVRGLEEVPRPITRPELLAAEEGGVVAFDSVIETVSVTGRTSVEALVAADRGALEQAARRDDDAEHAAG
ncbi:DNA recombination protein RmuC [Isoptericola variabilis J7]|uniref:RmuC-domain protein n=2 Tax=Isoptericola TaxID=254250 RepID=F6FPI1_ISOV2|nr:RmuC-domain protein [Isoptericola variabilis 225]TWH27374.1 DNA recombination protein RmuC [Isoptericola variabilis J7]